MGAFYQSRMDALTKPADGIAEGIFVDLFFRRAWPQYDTFTGHCQFQWLWNTPGWAASWLNDLLPAWNHRLEVITDYYGQAYALGFGNQYMWIYDEYPPVPSPNVKCWDGWVQMYPTGQAAPRNFARVDMGSNWYRWREEGAPPATTTQFISLFQAAVEASGANVVPGKTSVFLVALWDLNAHLHYWGEDPIHTQNVWEPFKDWLITNYTIEATGTPPTIAEETYFPNQDSWIREILGLLNDRWPDPPEP